MGQNCVIAEHDPWEIHLLNVFVERLGLCPLQVFAGQDVLPLVREVQPELILLESELPGAVCCTDVLCALKADLITCDIPVFVLAWSAGQAATDLAAGATGWLEKPVAYRALRDAVHAAIGRHCEDDGVF